MDKIDKINKNAVAEQLKIHGGIEYFKNEADVEKLKNKLQNVKWMEFLSTLYPEFTKQNMTQIVIPGSHDSGTYAITPTSPRAADLDSGLVTISKVCNDLHIGLAGDIIANFAITQERDVYWQLSMGARYIDLRLQVDSQQSIFCVHGLIGAHLTEILNSLKKWISENPKEVVIVHVQKIYSSKFDSKSPSLRPILIGYIKAEFINKGVKFCEKEDLKTPIGELWNKTKTVILLTPDDDEYVDNPWFNVPTAAQLRKQSFEFTQQIYKENQLRKKKTQLIVLQTILTPDQDTIVNGIKDKLGLFKIQNVFDWLPGVEHRDYPQSLQGMISRESKSIVEATQFRVQGVAKDSRLGCVFLADFQSLLHSLDQEFSLFSEKDNICHQVTKDCTFQIKLAVAANIFLTTKNVQASASGKLDHCSAERCKRRRECDAYEDERTFRASGLFGLSPKDIPPTFNKIVFHEYANWRIEKLLIIKKLLSNVLQSVVKSAPGVNINEDLYHVEQLFVLKNQSDWTKTKYLLVSKDEVVYTTIYDVCPEIKNVMEVHPTEKAQMFKPGKVEEIQYPIKLSTYFYKLIAEATKKGWSLWEYDPILANCQYFVWWGLVANNLDSPELRKFILQESSFKKVAENTRKFAKGITSTASILSRAFGQANSKF